MDKAQSSGGSPDDTAARSRAGAAVPAGFRRFLLPAVLTFAVGAIMLVAYWPALSGMALFFDDHACVARNQHVQAPGRQSLREPLNGVRRPSGGPASVPGPPVDEAEKTDTAPAPTSSDAPSFTTAPASAAASGPVFAPLQDAVAGEWCRYRMRDDQSQEVRVVGVESGAVLVEVKMFRRGRPFGRPAIRREPPDRDPILVHPARVPADVAVTEAAVEAAGSVWPCRLVTETWTDEEVAYVRRSWYCAKAPAYGLVRMEMTADGRPYAAMELIDYGPR